MIDQPLGRRVGGRKLPPWSGRALLLVLIGVSIFAGLVFDAAFGKIIPLHPERIQTRLDGLGAWAPIVFVMLMATAVVVTPIASLPLDIAAGLTFGLFWGTVYTLIGAEIGAVIAFMIARRLGRPRLAHRLPAAVMSQIDALSARRGMRALLVMRVLPIFNFDWVSYAAGLTAISLRVFATATFVGMIPPVVAIVAVGAILPNNPTVAAAILAALVLTVVIPLVVAWRRKSHKEQHAL